MRQQCLKLVVRTLIGYDGLINPLPGVSIYSEIDERSKNFDSSVLDFNRCVIRGGVSTTLT